MRFNFFGGNVVDNLELVRANYVKENKLKKEIKMLPCTKYIACQDKLSKGYVLALTDQAEIETMKVASLDDIEFYEGYDIAYKYTDELRKLILKELVEIYENIDSVIKCISNVEKTIDADKKHILNDKKMNLITYGKILNNIYQCISMTDNGIDYIANYDHEMSMVDADDILILIRELVEKIISLDSKIIIDYINRHLRLIILQLMNFINAIMEIKK